MRRAAVMFALAVAVALHPATGQAQSAEPPAAPGRIVGRVVSAETGAALGNARVELNRLLPAAPSSGRLQAPGSRGGRLQAAGPGGGRLQAARDLAARDLPLTKTTVADDSGIFEFTDLPAGDFSLQASRPGYRLAGVRRSRSLAAFVQVSVIAGRGVEVALPMQRAGAITGRVVDVYGEPLADVQVHALRWSYDEEGRRAARSAGVGDLTDDLGQFRVYDLPAGDYAVVATSRDPAGLLASFNPLGRTEMAPTYFPGTPNLAESQPVTLGPGAEAAVQFAVSPARTVRVAGTAVASNGSPASGIVTIWPRTGSFAMRSEPIAAGGLFSIGGLSPGEYWMNVDSRLGRPGEAASIPVTLGADDLTDLSIVTRAGATIRGTLVFDGPRPRSEFRLAIRQVEGRSGPYGLPSLGGVVTAGPDGRFEAAHVLGRVTFSTLDDEWMVKAVTAGGADVLDRGIDLSRTEAVNGVRITVTNRLATIAGRVADGGEPLSDFLVVVLRLDGVTADALGLRTVRTDASGRFETSKLRPGSYVAGVVEDLEQGYHLSPEFQDRLRERGQRFALGDGERVQLELIPTPGLE